jgi:RNase H-fold protein (predicted Holliday junction resolvase)
MVTLGIDASTTTVGYAFTEDKKILEMGFIDIKTQKTPKNKTFFVLTQLHKSPYIDRVEKINIEDSLSGFMGGRTSQQVIVKLAKFNAILSFVLEDEFQVLVENINPSTGRKKVLGKARVKGIKSKDYVREQIEQRFDTKKWCKTTTRGNFDPRNIDSYDALVMSLCG